MTQHSQTNAVRAYRKRLEGQGMKRFEVIGLAKDRDLVRALTRRLAEPGGDAEALRTTVRCALGGEPTRGGILEALRRSPMVGADLDLSRPEEQDRDPVAF